MHIQWLLFECFIQIHSFIETFWLHTHTDMSKNYTNFITNQQKGLLLSVMGNKNKIYKIISQKLHNFNKMF